MNDLSVPAILDRTRSLSGHLKRGASFLAAATTAAEVLEAKAVFSETYDEAKRLARFAEAKGAHDRVLTSIHRAQAEALEGEASAKRLLADEYDAAQARGEIATRGDNLKRGPEVPQENIGKATSEMTGISRKDMHEARMIRDAEVVEPGVVRRTINEAVAAGEEPTRATVRRAVIRTARPDIDASRQPLRGKAAAVARVRDAVSSLYGLPSPHEVIGYLQGTDEAALIGERLPAVIAWFTEFAELWTEASNAEAAE